MPRLERKIMRTSVRFYEDTLDYLGQMARSREISRDRIIREIIDQFILRMKDIERKKIDEALAQAKEEELSNAQ